MLYQVDDDGTDGKMKGSIKKHLSDEQAGTTEVILHAH